MIDVTSEVETKTIGRVNGGAVRDELWHAGERIGYLEPMGPVLSRRDYKLGFVPSRSSILEQHIYRLEEHELEDGGTKA